MGFSRQTGRSQDRQALRGDGEPVGRRGAGHSGGGIDRYVYDQALALFLCAPQVLYAVSKHVKFGPYRTTFELAETEVDDEHWSRHCGKGGDSGGAQRETRGKSTTGYPGAGC
jgi:hypothetical protein